MKISQVRTLSVERLGRRIGAMNADEVDRYSAAPNVGQLQDRLFSGNEIAMSPGVTGAA